MSAADTPSAALAETALVATEAKAALLQNLEGENQ